jgi:hypothetical protein
VYGGACPKPSGALEMMSEMHYVQPLKPADKRKF